MNVAIGPSSEARATELRSTQSGDKGIAVSFHLSHLSSDARSATEDSVQFMQKLFGLCPAMNVIFF